jgi:hypothetical protein
MNLSSVGRPQLEYMCESLLKLVPFDLLTVPPVSTIPLSQISVTDELGDLLLAERFRRQTSLSKERSQDLSKERSQDSSEERSQDLSKERSQDLSKERSQDLSKERSQDSSEEQDEKYRQTDLEQLPLDIQQQFTQILGLPSTFDSTLNSTLDSHNLNMRIVRILGYLNRLEPESKFYQPNPTPEEIALLFQRIDPTQYEMIEEIIEECD